MKININILRKFTFRPWETDRNINIRFLSRSEECSPDFFLERSILSLLGQCDALAIGVQLFARLLPDYVHYKKASSQLDDSIGHKTRMAPVTPDRPTDRPTDRAGSNKTINGRRSKRKAAMKQTKRRERSLLSFLLTYLHHDLIVEVQVFLEIRHCKSAATTDKACETIYETLRGIIKWNGHS